MRLENKEEYEGYFWFPNLTNRTGNTKGEKIGEIYPYLQSIIGRLTIDIDGSVSLSLNFPSWSGDTDAFNRFVSMGNRGNYDLSRIHGIIDNKKFVVLLGCQERGFHDVRNILGIEKKNYTSQFCIIRQQFNSLRKDELVKEKAFKETMEEKYPDVEDFNVSAEIDFNDVTDIEFDTLYFSFDRLDSYFQITGLSRLGDDNDEYDRAVRRIGAKIEWENQALNIHCGNDFTLRVETQIDYNNPLIIGSKKSTIQEYVRCVLDLPNPLPLEICVKKIEQIKAFFTFLFNRRIGITYLSGSLRGREFAHVLSNGEIHKELIRHEIHYQNNNWDPKQSPPNGYVPGRYKDFEESNGDPELFGKYLSSCVAKLESEVWFSDYFHSHLLSFSYLPLADQFTRRIQNFEYLFQEYLVPQKAKRKRIKNLAKKIKILINKANFPYQDDLTEKIRVALQKSNSFCRAKLYSEFIAKMRHSIVYPKKNQMDYDLLESLWRWLERIEKFYFLSMIQENDRMNKKIVERIYD